MFAISLQMISPYVKNEWKGLGNDFDWLCENNSTILFVIGFPT